MINNNKARRMLKNTFLHADRLIRRRDRLPEDEVEMRAQELLRQFVDDYEKLGSEATELKAEIANKYTEIKGLLQSNNPLGYALHNTYIATAISKPSLATIRSLFQDGDVGDPTQAGASNYVADTAISLTGNFTVTGTAQFENILIDDNKLFVGTKTNALELIEVQMEGKKRMMVNEFLKGNKNIKNYILL